ncbi:MAG: UDP-N-acetylmuramate--L-alanine ligase [Methanosaeta sp. PtaU1.Bin112]|nr:MAG: UDP-N-acetylmuramate--L-alanine ligase [Methanosaeta sp. PtaU1.Bin112]
MHRNTGIQAGDRGPRVAVLDTIHGAAIIARLMAESGLRAEAFEVYHSIPNLSDFDMVAAPVHLPPGNPALSQARRAQKRIITHHQAVGELLAEEEGSSMEVFEITGTHSKTSTALLLAMILSWQKKVLSHTTRGLEIWEEGKARLLEKGLSITPGNVIRAMQAAQASEAEALVCEISLGGTGLADYGIITSLSGDYPIAGATKWASTAKLQMLSLAKRGAKILANADARLSPEVSFARGGRIFARPDALIFRRDEVHLDLGQDLDFQGYETAIAAAAAAAEQAGIPKDTIAMALSGFDGFSGRMKIKRLPNQTIYDSSNSGLKVRDVQRALDRASGSNLVAVIGEDSQTVCEGMNIPALSDLLRQRRSEIAKLILVGERLVPLATELGAAFASNLQQGLEIAQKESPKRLLSCVKCFR